MRAAFTHSGASLRAGDYVRVGVECEIAVRLARDLPPSQAPFTADSVAEAIEAYLPAIEIVDDRYVEWQTLGAPTLVADDFFAAGCVLGKPVRAPPRRICSQVTGRALINGVEVGRGTGADVLGHPHNALAWLANHLAADGRGLRAGEIVLTGSLVKTVWLKAGDSVVMELEGLGRVAASFVSSAFRRFWSWLTRTSRLNRRPYEQLDLSEGDHLSFDRTRSFGVNMIGCPARAHTNRSRCGGRSSPQDRSRAGYA